LTKSNCYDVWWSQAAVRQETYETMVQSLTDRLKDVSLQFFVMCS